MPPESTKWAGQGCPVVEAVEIDLAAAGVEPRHRKQAGRRLAAQELSWESRSAGRSSGLGRTEQEQPEPMLPEWAIAREALEVWFPQRKALVCQPVARRRKII